MARIFVVEDETLILRLLTRLLERNGHEVHGFLAPERALEALDPNLELVVCDYNLPGIDGLELAARVKQRCPSARTLLLSGQLEDAAVAAALDSGQLDLFLPKPYDAEQLAEAVRSLLPATAGP
jgi:CheY-like chemotaxis protein